MCRSPTGGNATQSEEVLLSVASRCTSTHPAGIMTSLATEPELHGLFRAGALERACEHLAGPLFDPMEEECRRSLGVWAEQKRKLVNSDLHWEWCELAETEQRLCVVAPREHAKSEVFTVNQASWRSIYSPGHWSYLFANSGDQSQALLERVTAAVEQADPQLVRHARRRNTGEITFANYSKVTVAGSGKSVRGAHPDLICGDDVLEEGNAQTAHQRRAMERWWLGTIAGMSHPGTWRAVGTERVWMPPTRVFLVGTPFHQQDLLMSMRANPLYRFRRYAAEFDDRDVVDGLAVEVA